MPPRVFMGLGAREGVRIGIVRSCSQPANPFYTESVRRRQEGRIAYIQPGALVRPFVRPSHYARVKVRTICNELRNGGTRTRTDCGTLCSLAGTGPSIEHALRSHSRVWRAMIRGHDDRHEGRQVGPLQTALRTGSPRFVNLIGSSVGRRTQEGTYGKRRYGSLKQGHYGLAKRADRLIVSGCDVPTS